MSTKWPKVRLGEVMNERREEPSPDDLALGRIKIVEKIAFDTGCIQLRTGGETRTGMIMIYPGDLVVSGINAAKGAIAVYDSKNSSPIAATIHYGAYVPNYERVSAEFLWWLLRSQFFRELLLQYVPGGIKTELKAKRLLSIPVPLPPLAEQQRIVARIEELATQIHEARALRQHAAEEAEALVLSVLHRQFVVESSNWTLMPMDRAIEISDKQIDPTLPEYAQLPHISGENMESKTCRLLPWRTAEADGVKSSNYLFSPGTILYSKIRPYLRKAIFVDFRGVCSADVYPIRVINPDLDSHFVKWSLVAEPFTNYANRLSGRTRMPKLNRKQLFSFPFTHPPLSKQRQIVDGLDALQMEVERLKRLQAKTRAEIDALIPSVLDKAFKGEL